MQNVVQQCFVDLHLIKHLLNAREIFVPANTGSDGDDVLRLQNFGRYAFIFD